MNTFFEIEDLQVELILSHEKSKKAILVKLKSNPLNIIGLK